MRLLAAESVLVPLLLAGCGSFRVDAEGVKGFSPASQVWQIESNSSADRHSLVLSSAAGYCGKKRQAEQERIEADARHEERLDEGVGACESEDERLDDLASAYAPMEGDGVASFVVTIDREGASSVDARTAPEAGEYRQVGSSASGRFVAQYLRMNGKVARNRAEAWNCLDPAEVDQTNWQEYLAEVEPGLLDAWNLDSGILVVEQGGDDSWRVDVEGDLLDGSSTVGELQASFVARRCAIPMDEGEVE